jgi:hypothetical protein
MSLANQMYEFEQQQYQQHQESFLEQIAIQAPWTHALNTNGTILQYCKFCAAVPHVHEDDCIYKLARDMMLMTPDEQAAFWADVKHNFIGGENV